MKQHHQDTCQDSQCQKCKEERIKAIKLREQESIAANNKGVQLGQAGKFDEAITAHEEAVQLANSSSFGLAATVWSNDLSKAESIAKELEVGAVAINRLMSSDPRIPFGGVKKSGIGRELGKEGLLSFVNIKSVVISQKILFMDFFEYYIITKRRTSI